MASLDHPGDLRTPAVGSSYGFKGELRCHRCQMMMTHKAWSGEEGEGVTTYRCKVHIYITCPQLDFKVQSNDNGEHGSNGEHHDIWGLIRCWYNLQLFHYFSPMQVQ